MRICSRVFCRVFLLAVSLWNGVSMQAASPTIVYSVRSGGSGVIWLATLDGQFATPLTSGHSPRVSRDGHYMVFERDTPDFARGNVYVRDMTTGSETLIYGNGDYVVWFDFTDAQGSQIVFDYSCDVELMNRDGSNRRSFFGGNCYDDAPNANPVDGRISWHNVQGGGGIFIINADGSDRHLVPNTQPNDIYPNWSPDGQWISFSRGANIYKIRDTGENLTALTTLTASGDGMAPRPTPWTPDGSEVVTFGTVNGTNGIYRIETDGSGTVTRVPFTPAADMEVVGSVLSTIDYSATADIAVSMTPAFSPVAIGQQATLSTHVTNSGPATAHSVFLTNTFPTGTTFLGAQASQGSFTMNGNTIVFDIGTIAAGSESVLQFTVTADVGGLVRFGASAGAAETDLNLANNTNGTQLVVADPKVNGVVYGRADGTIWVFGADGSDTQLTTGRWPHLSADGKWMLFHRGGSSDVTRTDLWIRDLASGGETNIFGNGDFLVGYDFTPDSSQVVYDYSCDMEWMNLDGSNRRQLFGGNCYDDGPSVNLFDGRVAFHNTVGGGGIGIVNADGSGKHFLPNTNPQDVWPAWSPDGQWIAFMNGPDLYMIHPDGSGRTNVTHLVAAGDTYVLRPVWASRTNIAVAGTLGGDNGVFLVPTTGGITYRLATSDGAPIESVGGVTASVPVGLSPAKFVNIRGGTDAQIHFQLTTDPGRDYKLISSPDFVNWSPVSTNTAVSRRLDYALPAAVAQNFYRAVPQ